MNKIKFRSFLIIMVFLLFPSLVLAEGSATLLWQANTEADLAGYRIYYGTHPGVYGSTTALITGTSYTISGLEEGKTYYFVVTAVDTAGNESGYSMPEVSKTIPVSKTVASVSNDTTSSTSGETGSSAGNVIVSSTASVTTVPLPAIGEYGTVAGLDPNQDKEVHFSFAGVSGPVTANYEIYDINDKSEVQILINGHLVGNAPLSGDETWLEGQTVILPDEYVNDSDMNILTFYNTKIPPDSNIWGVRDVSIE